VLRAESSRRAARATARVMAGPPRIAQPRAALAGRLPPAARQPRDSCPPGGRTVMGVPAPSLLIIVPAYNEEDAIGGVVEGVRRAVPGVPVLVIDDCSVDGTVACA